MLAISRVRDGREVWDERVNVGDETTECGGEAEMDMLYVVGWMVWGCWRLDKE
jgi:hypothetical protein